MKQRSGSSSLFALKLTSFASLVKWCTAHYTHHMKCHVSLRDLYGLCVNAHTDSRKSQAVWMNQNQTIPGWFPEHITRVFSRISVWKRLIANKYKVMFCEGVKYIFHSLKCKSIYNFFEMRFYGFFCCYSVSHCSNKPSIKIIDWSFLCQWANVQNQQVIK